ncbi:MAG: hypothetical protein WKG07_08300 [Hymenobacter sp.]
MSLALVHGRSRPGVALGQAVRVLAGAGGPFSFGGAIYLSESALADLTAAYPALRHEQAHVRQWHTLDVLLAATRHRPGLAEPGRLAAAPRRPQQPRIPGRPRRPARRPRPPRLPVQPAAPAAGRRAGAGPGFSLLFPHPQKPHYHAEPTAFFHAPTGALFPGCAARGAAGPGLRRGAAQTAPATQARTFHPDIPDNALYYLDGKLSDKQVMDKIPPSTIFNIDIIKDEPAKIKQISGNTTATSAVIITTEANANLPAVLALVEKGDLGSGYTHTPAQVNALTPKALAYITQHYPDARLSGEVVEAKRKNDRHRKIPGTAYHRPAAILCFLHATG